MTPYQQEQLEAIHRWKARPPGVFLTLVNTATRPLGWAIQKLLPTGLLEAGLAAAASMARSPADAGRVLKKAGVERIADLRRGELELCDRLAARVQARAIGLASAAGTGTGLVGLPGIALDVPAILTLALRTIHRIGLCYGYVLETAADERFALAILGAAGANSRREKTAALALLQTLEEQRGAWKHVAERATAGQFSRAAAILAIRSLAQQLAANLAERRALTEIPVIGAAIGGSVNGWFLREVGWAARRCFQERWLRDNLPLASEARPD